MPAPLYVASHEGSAHPVSVVLIAGADVNLEGGEHGIALYAAAAEGDKELVQSLVEAGADVNAEGGEHNTALLQAAAQGGYKGVVQTLVEAGSLTVSTWLV